MDDTNIVLHLKDGEEVKVIYPHRVFTEYHTPWLDHPGGVQTSNPTKDLADHLSGDYFRNANFVISTWENFPEYESKTDGRIRTVPMCKIVGIVPADRIDAEIGNRIRREEETKMQDENYKQGVVSREELARLFPHLADQILTRPQN